ncbi:MAG: UDP-4-amino-4,6-dideoxy-N-acetyl-beta-L-altrosamine transaminase [Legionellaceae bacterium]|nr:UDP-4-amino-4,6-dideoxy-N-acetyl-beta-L-altrosamine transaminase [Legionellaceae bacterium]
MSDDFLPFAKPDISQAAIDEVVACIKSGWLTTGPRTKQFESDLETYLGAPYTLCLSSATAGLHLSLLALNLKPGDEVITTPMTFAATLNTIILAGGKPVLVDVEPGTYNIDVKKIAEAVTEKTRVIMPVHFAGLPVDLDPLYDIAKKHGLRVIEDAAHAIGAEYKKQRIGSFGDTQVFSFHPNKNMTTGEGGCITTRDDKITKQMMLMRFHGMDREAWNRFGKSGKQDYQIVFPGLKYNMMDMQAALGIHQLKRLDSFIDKRQQLVKRYYEKLAGWDAWQLPSTPDYEHRHAWHLFAPLINPEKAGMTREMFMEKMKEQNIGTGLHYHAVHLYPYYREHFGFKPGDFPHAETIGERVVSLPLFPSMTEDEQDRVIDAMRRVIES